jgi:hypothetical protein
MDKLAYMQHRFQLCKQAGWGTKLGRGLYRIFGSDANEAAQTARALKDAAPIIKQIEQLRLAPNSGIKSISYTATPGNTRSILVEAFDDMGNLLRSKNLSPNTLDKETLTALSSSHGNTFVKKLDPSTLNTLNNQALAIAAANPLYSKLGRRVIGGGLATTGAGLLYAGMPSSAASSYHGPYLR